MKKIILVLVYFFCFQNAFSQKLNYTLEENSVVYRKIIELDSIDKNNLYSRALQYFTFNYNQGDNVIQVQDKEQGIIVGKGLTPHLSSERYSLGLQSLELGVYHIIKFEIKDYKIRVSIYYTDYQIIWRGDSQRIRSSHILLEPPISNTPGQYINSQLFKKKAVKLTTNAFNEIQRRAAQTFINIEDFLKNTSSNNDW